MIAVDRQCPVKTLALDADSLGDFSDALSLSEVAQGNEQNPGLVFIFQRSFEILGCKIRVLPEPSNDGDSPGDRDMDRRAGTSRIAL
jgi:hypothetical protein